VIFPDFSESLNRLYLFVIREFWAVLLMGQIGDPDRFGHWEAGTGARIYQNVRKKIMMNPEG
jgi:hypothetical protein